MCEKNASRSTSKSLVLNLSRPNPPLMQNAQVKVATENKTDVATAMSVSFFMAVSTLTLAALLDTFLIAFLVSALK